MIYDFPPPETNEISSLNSNSRCFASHEKATSAFGITAGKYTDKRNFTVSSDALIFNFLNEENVELNDLLDSSLLRAHVLANDDTINQSITTTKALINQTTNPSTSAPNRKFEPVTNSELKSLKQSRIPTTTARREKWAMKLFRN